MDLFDIKVQSGKNDFRIPGIDELKNQMLKHILFIPISFSLLAGSTNYQKDNLNAGGVSIIKVLYLFCDINLFKF